MPNTANREYPYPNLDAPANVPLDMQALADDLDADVQDIDTRLTTATTDLANATPGNAAGQLIRRASDGSFAVGTPTAASAPTPKNYVDGQASAARTGAVSDAKAYTDSRAYANRTTITPPAPPGQTTVAFTMPSGRYTATPVAVASALTTDPARRLHTFIGGADTTSVTVVVWRTDSSATTCTINLVTLAVG